MKTHASPPPEAQKGSLKPGEGPAIATSEVAEQNGGEHVPVAERRFLFDAAAMRRRFQLHFESTYPELPLQVKRVFVGRVYHKPGKRCTILYQVEMRLEDGSTVESWFQGIVSDRADGKTKRTVSEPPESWPGCAPWKPYAYWDSLQMELLAFPFDPKLPYMGRLYDADVVRELVSENIGRFGFADTARCTAADVQVVKFIPKKRAVQRVRVEITDANGGMHEVVFYGKTMNHDDGVTIFAALRQINESEACRSGRLYVPAALLYIEDSRTMWLTACEGTGLKAEITQDRDRDALSRSDVPEKIAHLLGELQSVPPDGLGLPDGPSPADVHENATGDAADILSFRPEWRNKIDAIMAEMTRLQPQMESGGTQTLIHGTFKIGQLLSDGERLTLIDFDSVAIGDPIYDLAEMMASFVYLQISHELPPAVVNALVERLYRAYDAHVSWTAGIERAAWYVTGMLLGKLHSSLKRDPDLLRRRDPFVMLDEWLFRARR